MAIALAVCIAPALLVFHVGTAPLRSSVSAYTPHGPIAIDGDADFHLTAASEGWPGSGTPASPYIISGYEFAGPEGDTAFLVGNSAVYFVVRDCYFHGSSSAFYLMMSTNAVFENSTVEGCEVGMVLYLSTATVANNSISDCTYAVLNFMSDATTYSANYFEGSLLGLCIMDSDNNVASGNTFERNTVSGLAVVESHFATLRDNVLLKDGIMLGGDAVSAWDTHDIDTSNTVNGEPVLYLADDVGSTVTAEYGQVLLANCVGTVVDSQDLENTSMGVIAGSCSDVTIQGSTLRDNYCGVLFDSCDNTTITGTYSINNTIGIDIEDSVWCDVTSNTFISDLVGIATWNATDTSITNNILGSEEVAIDLVSSIRMTLRSNSMAGCGIFIEGSALEYWNSHDIDTTNSVNWLPVVYLKNLIGDAVPNGAGQVILANCAQMVVAGSYIDRATAAFQLGFSSGCRVTTLSASNCEYGVRLYQSPGIQVDNAMLSDDVCGVWVEASNMCTITTNWIRNCTNAAILLLDSDEQTLQFNIMTNCGIQMGSGMLSGWNTHAIDGSNYVNGMPVYYRKDASGLAVPGGYGQIILANCISSVVGPQTIVNATAALQLGFCNDITVNNLTASGNIFGALFEQSDNCDLKGPWFTHNVYGVYMESGMLNTVTNGLFYMNEEYAVYLGFGAYDNIIAGNTFQYNRGSGDSYDLAHVQAYDDGADNLWNGASSGNYWQDWQTPDGDGNGIVDVPYEIDGFARAVDNYPLTTPTQVIPELGLVQMLFAMVGIVAVVGVSARRRRVQT